MNNTNPVDKRERYYKRNYYVFLLEGFFFSFALTIFSHSTVLPVYISNITTNRFWISFLALTFFGLSNSSTIISSVIGVNAKSAKWIAVILTGTQRIGLFFIFLSTYFLTGSESFSLLMFFISYSVFGFSVGMANPVFSNMVSNVIYRNVSSFYGSYALMGGIAGVISSQMISYFIDYYAFPLNYRYLFLFGLIMAIMSTLTVIFGIKEVPRDRIVKITYRELPKMMLNIWKENHQFRSFILIRLFTSAAEMTLPFFIISVSLISGVNEGVVGVMSTILLISNLLFAKIMGNLGDKKGPMFLIQLGCVVGVLSNFLALFLSNIYLAGVLFVLISITMQSVMVSNSVSIIVYADKNYVPIFAAMSGLLVAPVYSLFSLGGGLVARQYDFSYLYVFSLGIYLLAGLLAHRFQKQHFKS
jgi:MFS family permease